MRIAITGATGLLGRNLLFEVIKKNLDNLDELEIFILGRSSKNETLKERVLRLLITDGFYYVAPNEKSPDAFVHKLEKCMIYIPFDLTTDQLGIPEESLKELKQKPIDYFFHLAALSDFRSNRSVKELLTEINVAGTNRILELISQLEVGEAIYAGTAYSCGVHDQGTIRPQQVDFTKQFRNYYEETKLIAERNFRVFLARINIPFRIFRFVGICGRLIEYPIGATNKYDIFYGWASFFLRYKLKILRNLEKIYHHPLELSIRIACNKEAGLNIVPADYAAKIMYAVCIHGDSDHSYHIAAETDISHRVYLSIILDELNIKGYEFIDEEPAAKNELEKLYYKSVGKIFGPYLTSKKISFDRSNLAGIEKKTGLFPPKLDEEKFRGLLHFAKNKYFGISRQAVNRISS